MQKKTKYCNSLVSKVLPTINEIGDNNLIFNQIDNSLCFKVWKAVSPGKPMNRRMGEGGEGDAGIKRNILRPEIRGNTKRNVNCIRKGNRE